jgi:hypothetical protein
MRSLVVTVASVLKVRKDATNTRDWLTSQTEIVVNSVQKALKVRNI